MIDLSKKLRIEGLIKGGFIPAGLVYDKNGSPAVLDENGMVSIFGTTPASLSASASAHNFIVNSIMVKKNGWFYWHVDVDGELIPLNVFRQHFNDTILLNHLKSMFVE